MTTRETIPDEKLIGLWTRQLYREYDHVTFQYRVRLRAPVIRIDDGTSRWGSWDPVTREIRICRRLIDTYPWPTVIEILKHEMAHQYVDDFFGGETNHGPMFHEACARLGVAEWAQRASGELPREIPNWKMMQLNETEERLLQRVEKLLALANSTNEHEAALAMQRVQEMYRKYNLEQIRAERASTMVYAVIHRKKKRISQAESMIFSILTEFFFVKAIYGKIYDAVDCCEYSMVELLGTRENVRMAEYVHGFLWSQIHSLWDTFRTNHRASPRRKGSYLVGVLVGFRDKLRRHETELHAEAQAEGTAKTASALIAIADRQLDAFVDTRHPRLANRGQTSMRWDSQLFSAGKADGARICLRKAVTQQDGNRGHLLKR